MNILFQQLKEVGEVKYENLQTLCAIALATLIIINVLMMVAFATSLFALVPMVGAASFTHCLFLASQGECKTDAEIEQSLKSMGAVKQPDGSWKLSGGRIVRYD